jgi:formylglycine-generating enzyme required for sulfatase activity
MNMNLGDYSIVKSMGKGALGEVFLAQHRFLKRMFALKVLPSEMVQDKGFIHRFEREVAALSTLDHPHIVKVHNVSEVEGKYFLVSDCIVDDKGETLNLAQYLAHRGGKLPEEEVVRIVHQVASALDYAHGRAQSDPRFAHRGVKLSNILVSKKREGVWVYLSDFGLTRIVGVSQFLSRIYQVVAENVGSDPAQLPHLQRSFLQSYLFLAPEQKVSDTLVSDVKADVYAFGVLVYLLLTGRYPEGMFDLPSQLAPHYKLGWDRLVKSCLQNDPHKRPAQLKTALEELLPQAAEAAPSTDEPLKPMLNASEIVRPEFDADPSAIFKIETSVGRYLPQADTPKENEPIPSEMVIIRGGTFFRGSNTGARDEMPRHAIDLNPFALDIHPVTNEQFARFLDAMGGEKDQNNNDIIRLRESRIKRSGGKLNIESGYAKHPVVGVTWYGAVAYAKWVGKRLPTEAEWEVAAEGGHEESVYPTGINIERTQANFFSSDTTPVMSYPPNDYGFYDMAGNVYEWCHDWYDYHYYDMSVQEPGNPKGPLQGVYRILRGGCWKSLKEDLRCSHRHRNNPGTVNGTYGFRCAADVSH